MVSGHWKLLEHFCKKHTKINLFVSQDPYSSLIKLNPVTTDLIFLISRQKALNFGALSAKKVALT